MCWLFYSVVCVDAEGYQSNSTDMTSSFQTEHQLLPSHSSFNTDTICVLIRKLHFPQRSPQGPVGVEEVFENKLLGFFALVR